MMTHKQAIEKELMLLLRRHNKNAKVKLKNAEVIIPEEILDLLCQKEARSSVQKVIIEDFRRKALEQLYERSTQLYKERQEKAKRTREANLEKDPRYVRHFGIWVNTELASARISREHYAMINKRPTVVSDAQAKYMIENGHDYPVRIDDESGDIFYTDEWCLQHQAKCLENFDINIKKYASLDFEDFEKALMRFVKGRKFQEIFSLDESICTEFPGYSTHIVGFVYIMVLDAYKQVYIGITANTVKCRIEQHWKGKRAFDRLLWGTVEKSVLSIDSFGPLDTTRIFVMPYSKDRKTSIELYESICIKAFDQRYLLNRLR